MSKKRFQDLLVLKASLKLLIITAFVPVKEKAIQLVLKVPDLISKAASAILAKGLLAHLEVQSYHTQHYVQGLLNQHAPQMPFYTQRAAGV